MRIRTLLNPFSCRQRYTKYIWQEQFPNFQGILDVEIGFGRGDFLERYAVLKPTHALVGFEIRKQLVTAAQERLWAKNIDNALLIWGNGQYGLEDLFDDGSINHLFIFHPDPWLKNGQRKRRLISPQFLQLAAHKLKPGGLMSLATDVPNVWQYMTQQVEASGHFTAVANDEFWLNDYHTRWKEISMDQQRNLFYTTFKRV